MVVERRKSLELFTLGERTTAARQPLSWRELSQNLRSCDTRWMERLCVSEKKHMFVCSQRICQNLKDDTSPADGKNVPILFTALSSGLILVLIVASTIGILVCRRSKTKKEETMDLDESHVYESNTALMRLLIQMIIRDNKLLNKI